MNISIDHITRSVETQEYGRIQDEEIYLEACNEDIPESSSPFD